MEQCRRCSTTPELCVTLSSSSSDEPLCSRQRNLADHLSVKQQKLPPWRKSKIPLHRYYSTKISICHSTAGINSGIAAFAAFGLQNVQVCISSTRAVNVAFIKQLVASLGKQKPDSDFISKPESGGGGGGGNRTPVRKLAYMVFSERICDFGIPLTIRLTAGLWLR